MTLVPAVAAAALSLALSAAPPHATNLPNATNATNAIAGIAKIYDTHPLIFVGEWHRNAQQHEFLRALIADPAFICRTDDIVVEFGNARLQPIADRWSNGGDVSEAELVSMYRETEVMFAWNAPMYRAFYEAVRDVNRSHACPHPVRLVLGDPPLDWAKIENVGEFKALPDRDRFFADVVEREVLAKKHRALLISGALHALRKYPKREPGDDAGFGEPSAAQLIEKEHPGSLFIIALVTTPAAAETMQMPPPPSFRVVGGSALEKTDFSIIAPAWDAKPVVVNGKHDWKLEDSNAWGPMGEVVDGVLYLGGDRTRVFPSPSIYLDPAYQAELRKRAAIIKAYNGQDFGVILDDLIKDARASEKKPR